MKSYVLTHPNGNAKPDPAGGLQVGFHQDDTDKQSASSMIYRDVLVPCINETFCSIEVVLSILKPSSKATAPKYSEEQRTPDTLNCMKRTFPIDGFILLYE